MARRRTWIDFYNELTANAQSAATAHSAGALPSTTALSYGTYASENARYAKGGNSSLASLGGRDKDSKKAANKNKWTVQLGSALGPMGLSLGMGLDAILPHLFGSEEEKAAAPQSAGGRILDVMARPNYAMANYTQALGDQGEGKSMGEQLQPNLFDPKSLGALWQGLTGEKKRTFSDNLADDGMEPGFGRSALGFGLDVIADPTTYIGAGAAKTVVKGGVNGLRGIRGGEVAAKDFAGTAAPAVNTADNAGTAIEGKIVPDGQGPELPPSFSDFFDQLMSREGRAQHGIPGDVFDASKPAPVGAVDNRLSSLEDLTPEIFSQRIAAGESFEDIVASIEAVANNKARLLPGPTPEVITQRAGMSELDDLAKQSYAWRYNTEKLANDPEASDILDNGWWQGTRRLVPPDNPGGGGLQEYLRLTGLPETKVMEETAKVQARYAHLAEKGDQDIASYSPLVKAIMSRVDEKVYPSYHPREISVSSGKGGKRTQTVWEPRPEDVKDHNFKYMGDIRERLAAKPLSKDEYDALMAEAQTATPERRAAIMRQVEISKPLPEAIRKQLQAQLVGHIKAVKEYSQSGAPGFKKGEKGGADFIKEMYGRDITKVSSGMPEIPVGPLKAQPKYSEIVDYQKLPPEFKKEFLEIIMQKYGISRVDAIYLSKAGNKASYDTRLYKVLTESVDPIKDTKDLLKAIDEGRINPIDVPDLMKKFNVKTMKQLATAIRKKQNDLTKAEKAMIGKYVPDLEGNVVNKNLKPPAQVVGGIREVGPTGAPYKTYEGKADIPPVAKSKKMAREAVERAQTTPHTQQIIDEVKAGDNTNIVEPMAQLTTSQNGMYARALHRSMKAYEEAKALKYKTRTGARRGAAAGKKGPTYRLDTWTSGDQYTQFRQVMSDFSAQFAKAQKSGQLEGLGLKGKDIPGARADMAYRQVMPVLEHLARTMRQRGVFGVLGSKNIDTPVGMHDVLDAIDPLWVKRNIFNLVGKTDKNPGYSIVPPTKLMDAMDIAVTAVREGDIAVDDYDNLMRVMFDEISGTKAANGSKIPSGVKAAVDPQNGDVEVFMQPLMDAIPDLVRRAEKYDAERALYHGKQVAKGTKSGLDAIAREVTAPDSTVTKAMGLSNTLGKELMPKITRLHGLDPDDAWQVEQQINAALPEMGVTPELRATAKMAQTRSTLKTAAERTDHDVDSMEQTIAAVNRDLDEMGVDLNDFLTRFDKHFLGKAIREFFPHFGNERLRPLYLNREGSTQTISRLYHSALTDLKNNHSADDIQKAWNNLQLGEWSTNPKIGAAQKDLNKAIMTMFSEEHPYSMYSRNGLTAAELNAHFDHFGISNKFRFHKDGNMFQEWKNWDTDEPLDLLSKVMAASNAALSKKILGDHLMATFGSKVKKPGYVKLSGRHEIMRYIDADRYYFPADVAHEMAILNRFLKQTIEMTPSSGIARFYDSAMHSLKSLFTIYRPGHHIRNEVGDVWLSHMAGVNDPRVYAKAAKVEAMYRGSFNDFDAIGHLTRGDAGDIAAKRMAGKSQDTILTTRVKGKPVKMTAGEIYRAAFDKGLLTDYRSLEDIGGTGKSLLHNLGLEGQGVGKKITDRIGAPTGGRAHKIAAATSEIRDHHVRLAHFIDYLEKGNFKSLDDAFENGASVVRKWHPDGSDLSHFEKRYARRTILFYSWIRKAIPLVLESMLMKPGKALIYPKFMYNMAEAQGIDLDSYGNPFPEDQMFPEWMREGLQGPATGNAKDGYYGISPGIPMLDVLGDYAGFKPWQAVVGSASPLFKIPAETAIKPEGAVAQDARTGIPFFDRSDYIDKQIPMSNMWTATTGRSLTQPWQAKGGDRNADVLEENGMFAEGAGRTFLNFLAGMGVTDMSKEAYIKQAKREQTMRNRER